MSNPPQKKITYSLGGRIKNARKDAGFTQRDLALAIRLTDKAISTYEVDRAEPSFDTLREISRVTHKPLVYFLDQSDQDDLDLQMKLRRIEADILDIKKLLGKRVG
jgi:transcriptional regulator with XRE-family HTH domain